MHIGISRETVSRIISKWKEQGIEDMNFFRRCWPVNIAVLKMTCCRMNARID
ncbi:helix-turn-helix domain-containing protein [Virgibacillus oceani]